MGLNDQRSSSRGVQASWVDTWMRVLDGEAGPRRQKPGATQVSGHIDAPAVSGTTRVRPQVLQEALAPLRPEERAALSLKFQLGMDYTAMARLLGKDEAATRTLVYQGLKRLRSIVATHSRDPWDYKTAA